jgi:hypothetical protein
MKSVTLSIMTFSLVTFSIMTSDTVMLSVANKLIAECRYAECRDAVDLGDSVTRLGQSVATLINFLLNQFSHTHAV